MNNLTVNKPWSIGIVGTGASAVALFSYLITQLSEEHWDFPIEVTLFERNPAYLSRGIAYQKDADSLLLNRDATEMTLFPEDATHFRRWVQNNPKHRHHLEISEFVPRHVFGDYLNEIFNDTIAKAKTNGIKVNVIQTEIIKLDKDRDGYTVYGSKGNKYEFDFVSLCLGHPQGIDHYHLNGAKNYIHHPHPARDTLKVIPKHAKVGVIGAGLTAIDLVNTLKAFGHTGKMHFINRSGLISNVRRLDAHVDLKYLTYEKVLAEADKNNGQVSLKWVLKSLRKDMQLVNKDWRKEIFPKQKPKDYLGYFNEKVTRGKAEPNRAFDVLRLAQPIIGEAWGRMSEKDRLFFNKNYLNRYLCSRVYTPMLNGERINSLLQSSQLEIHGGIQDIVENTDGTFTAKFRENKYEQYDYIVNGSGSAVHVQRDSGNRLIMDLLDKGYANIEPCGGVKVNFENGALIDADGFEDSNLRLIGHMAFGRYFLINNMPPIQKTTATIAKELRQMLERQFVFSNQASKKPVFNQPDSIKVETIV